ncbi:hypothetical protein CN423_19320 [Bacillus cereus]|uniref:hypothetical protein n=1 Tax=Bacillus cereus TaxID=1396 RepID=UPI000BEBF6C1|nr:hypothetical protein [Bacillus cereus]PED02906.1 hypothetical protein CON14_10245 [Bacillus cereus]PEQ27253.1 hypothetical protein CN466_28440 [Bacillus cereus]PEV62896.1 hypothetical protein CN423_19320 [Bacillus cereus]PEX59148.1 hypothetical protein CN463_22825 [Bacillus cereus]PFC21592.1 hypothetical protein CN264_24690 [Bacillus cereus]
MNLRNRILEVAAKQLKTVKVDLLVVPCKPLSEIGENLFIADNYGMRVACINKIEWTKKGELAVTVEGPCWKLRKHDV